MVNPQVVVYILVCVYATRGRNDYDIMRNVHGAEVVRKECQSKRDKTKVQMILSIRHIVSFAGR